MWCKAINSVLYIPVICLWKDKLKWELEKAHATEINLSVTIEKMFGNWSFKACSLHHLSNQKEVVFSFSISLFKPKLITTWSFRIDLQNGTTENSKEVSYSKIKLKMIVHEIQWKFFFSKGKFKMLVQKIQRKHPAKKEI